MIIAMKPLLTAIRAEGLTARSGFNPQRTPCLECANVVVLKDAAGLPVVINTCAASVLDGGCSGHPRYREVQAEQTSAVRRALEAAGVKFTQNGYDQFFINGYKPTR